MLEKYDYLNTCAKKYLENELNKICYKKNKNKNEIERCYKEINLLFDKGILFIVEILYKFKKHNKNVSYYFRGTTNNLLLLYVLGISSVDAIKYNLPYELFNDTTISIDLTSDNYLHLIWFIEEYNHNLKIIYCNHEKEDIKEIDELESNHYLLVPSFTSKKLLNSLQVKMNSLFLFETIEDYRKYTDDFLTVRIEEKKLIRKKGSLENVLTGNFEKAIAKILKPKTIYDFIKVKSIGHGTDVWNNNQEVLVREGKMNLDGLIASREDIFEYLLGHSIDAEKALEIMNFIRKGRSKKDSKKWNEYVKIMKKHGCEDMYIDIFSKILFISGRGQAVGDCLFALNKKNYLKDI